MTANHSIDPDQFLSEHLERAEPDLLRAMLKTFIEALMGAETSAARSRPARRCWEAPSPGPSSSTWSQRGVVIPHTTSNPTPDVRLVSHSFKSFTTDPAVCAALKRLKVAVVVDDSDRFQANDERQANYSGLVNPAGTSGLTLIDKGATAAIYRVGDCKGSTRPLQPGQSRASTSPTRQGHHVYAPNAPG